MLLVFMKKQKFTLLALSSRFSDTTLFFKHCHFALSHGQSYLDGPLMTVCFYTSEEARA